MYACAGCYVAWKEFGRVDWGAKLEKLPKTLRHLWVYAQGDLVNHIFRDSEDGRVLEELPILEDGVMPLLRILEVTESLRLKKIPEGLEGLKNLEELRVCWCRKWQKRLKEGREDWQNLRDKRPHMKIKIKWDDSSDSDSNTNN
eukprot:Gb_24280 [translate_table: standard]